MRKALWPTEVQHKIVLLSMKACNEGTVLFLTKKKKAMTAKNVDNYHYVECVVKTRAL